ncbi:hypothetical protein F511_05702 [Dorcoceras hygrometricum]|uniref:Uncharacterized protein n=1 Tax=Dorcoceras hygrometricum TaxID=472368 RepID=A0A2Z7BF41_9LAMI|nr:hypothetical protein F511_05702 [Dorcoceras hygrometricum]
MCQETSMESDGSRRSIGPCRKNSRGPNQNRSTSNYVSLRDVVDTTSCLDIDESCKDRLVSRVALLYLRPVRPTALSSPSPKKSPLCGIWELIWDSLTGRL